MTRLEILFSLFRIPLDIISVISAAFLAYFLRPSTDLIPFIQIPFAQNQLLPLNSFIHFSLFAALGFVFIASLQGMYQFSRKGVLKEFARLSICVLYLSLGIIAFYGVFRVETFFSRGILFMMSVFTIGFSVLGRWALDSIEKYLLKHGVGIKLIAIIGPNSLREELLQEIKRYPQFCVSYHATTFIPEEIEKESLQELWVIQQDGHDLNKEILDFAQSHHLLYRFIPDTSGTLHSKVEETTLGSFPVLTVKPTPLDGWGRIYKRMFDIFLASVMLILLSPLFCIVAILIKINSSGPVFYVSKRVGKNGILFPMLKFRSMIVNADELKASLEKQNHRKDSPLFKMKNDPRITPFGRFLRRYSIDELPQIMNVLIGTMSLVGPRAHLPSEVEKYSPDQRRVLLIKPGITGLPQISGRSDLAFQDEIRLDLHYIVEWSLFLDFKIILKTPFVLLQGRGAD